MNASALLVYDEPEDRAIWAHLFYQIGLDVSTIETGQEAIALLEKQCFELVLVSSCRPDMERIELCRNLRQHHSNPLLLLCPATQEEYILHAYKAGVDDYIPTSIAPRVFLAKLRVWLSRAETNPVALLDAAPAGLALDSTEKQIRLADGSCARLTQLEYRVLALLMSHQNRVMPANLIIDRVWGYSGADTKVLLKNVIYRLRRKVEQDPAAPRYIKTVPGEGYLYTPP